MNENRSSLVVGLSGLKRTRRKKRKKTKSLQQKLLLLFHFLNFLNLNPIIGQSYIIMVIFLYKNIKKTLIDK